MIPNSNASSADMKVSLSMLLSAQHSTRFHTSGFRRRVPVYGAPYNRCRAHLAGLAARSEECPVGPEAWGFEY